MTFQFDDLSIDGSELPLAFPIGCRRPPTPWTPGPFLPWQPRKVSHSSRQGQVLYHLRAHLGHSRVNRLFNFSQGRLWMLLTPFLYCRVDLYLQLLPLVTFLAHRDPQSFYSRHLPTLQFSLISEYDAHPATFKTWLLLATSSTIATTARVSDTLRKGASLNGA